MPQANPNVGKSLQEASERGRGVRGSEVQRFSGFTGQKPLSVELGI